MSVPDLIYAGGVMLGCVAIAFALALIVLLAVLRVTEWRAIRRHAHARRRSLQREESRPRREVDTSRGSLGRAFEFDGGRRRRDLTVRSKGDR